MDIIEEDFQESTLKYLRQNIDTIAENISLIKLLLLLTTKIKIMTNEYKYSNPLDANFFDSEFDVFLINIETIIILLMDNNFINAYQNELRTAAHHFVGKSREYLSKISLTEEERDLSIELLNELLLFVNVEDNFSSKKKDVFLKKLLLSYSKGIKEKVLILSCNETDLLENELLAVYLKELYVFLKYYVGDEAIEDEQFKEIKPYLSNIIKQENILIRKD